MKKSIDEVIEEASQKVTNECKKSDDRDKPEAWLNNARSFKLATERIVFEYMQALRANNINSVSLGQVITPFLYLESTTVELYLKTYLLAKGVPLSKVEKYKHELKKIYIKCLEYGDSSFDDLILKQVVIYGEVYLSFYGVKYPGIKSMGAIFPDYVTILDTLDKIVAEVVSSR